MSAARSPGGTPAAPNETTLVDLLDTVIGRGAAVEGDVVLGVADVDLVHVGLRLVLRGLDTPTDGRGGAAGGVRGSLPGGERVRGAEAARRTPPRAARAPERASPPRGATRVRPEAEDVAGDAISAKLQRLVSDGASGDSSPEDVQRGLAGLVLTLVEVLRELMERQALRRMDGGTLGEEDLERLGRTFLALRERMDELKEAFGLEDEDLNIDLGPLGALR